MNIPLNSVALRTQLAARARTQAELAEELGVPPTTLSGWLRGAHPAPSDLVTRIESALQLASGTLTSKEQR